MMKMYSTLILAAIAGVALTSAFSLPVPLNEEITALQDAYAVLSTPSRQTSWKKMITAIEPVIKLAVKYAFKVFDSFWKLSIGLLSGTAVGVALCTYTTICPNLSGFDFSGNSMSERVSQLARAYATPQNLNAASSMVHTAIEEYAKLQRSAEESADE